MTHQELVSRLAKGGAQILAEMAPEDAHRLHMVLGIAGEAGELVDAIKKAVIYRKPIDLENVVEELGDLEFYMEGLRQSLGIVRAETIVHNINKLTIRYAAGYSDRAAAERADKV